MANVATSSPLPFVNSVPPLDNTFGALLIGTFVGLTLYGLVVHQSYRYFRLCREDGDWLKVLVSAVLVFETFHIVLSMHACYHYLVTNSCHPYALLSGAWSINLLSATSGVVVIPSQRHVASYAFVPIIAELTEMCCPYGFFARRVFLLGGLKYQILVFLAFILFAAELGFLCAATAQAFAFPWFSRFQHYTWLVSAGTGTSFIADSLLTGVLVTLLRKEQTGSDRMNWIIEKIMLYAVNTGLLTGVVNLLFLLFSLLYPNNLIYAGFGIVATKLYANSLLAALNTRKSLQYTPQSLPTSAAGSTTLLTSRREMTVTSSMPGQAVTFHPAYRF